MKKLNCAFLLSLAVLAVELVAGCGPQMIVATATPPPASPIPPATSTTVPSPMAAPPTAVATSTATTAPTTAPSPTTALSPTGSAQGELIFREDFSGTNKHLNNNPIDVTGGGLYQNGVYHVVAQIPKTGPGTGKSFFAGGSTLKICSGKNCSFPDMPHLQLENVTAEVDVKRTAGAPDGLVGLACHFDQIIGSGSFYGGFVSSDGRRYAIVEGDIDRQYLLAGQDRGDPHPAIKQGEGAVNHLRLECVGSVVRLSVNGQVLAQADTTKAARPLGKPDEFGGGIALLAYTDTAPTVEADFDNLVVSKGTAQLAGTAPSTKTIFRDSFGPPGLWPRQKSTEATTDVTSEGFVMTVQKADIDRLAWPAGLEYGDTQIATEAVLTAGPEQSFFGVVCRKNGDNYYDFVIGADGQYSIGVQVKGKFKPLIDWTNSALIQKGLQASNQIRADCLGDTLTLYVNGQKVDQATDTQLKWGKPGLEAGSTKAAGGTSVLFKSFAVTRP